MYRIAIIGIGDGIYLTMFGRRRVKSLNSKETSVTEAQRHSEVAAELYNESCLQVSTQKTFKFLALPGFLWVKSPPVTHLNILFF